MGKQMTEMLKGTLEGIVLALLAAQPAYGYEITARLRDQGFTDIAEGTVYALLVRIEQRGLVDVEKVPSEKGPPRKVYSLNERGHQDLDEFWTTWNQRGRNTTAAKNPNAARNTEATEIVNDRLRNKPSVTMGSGARDSHSTKIAPMASPMRIRPPTQGSSQGREFLLVRPTRNGTSAAANRAAPT